MGWLAVLLLWKYCTFKLRYFRSLFFSVYMEGAIFGAYQEFIVDRDVKTDIIFLLNRHDEPLSLMYVPSVAG